MNTVQVMFQRADGVLLSAVEMWAEVTYEMDVPEGAARLKVNWPQAPTPPPPPSREDLPAFRAHVLGWLREDQHISAASVEKVSGYGTDWAGDTAGGFYSETSIEITYTDQSGKQHFKEATGDDFLSLWHWVVDVWPEPEIQQD